MINSPDTQARIAQLRVKSVEGTLTLEDMREAVQLIRADRRTAAVTSASARKPKAELKSPDEMLDELGAI